MIGVVLTHHVSANDSREIPLSCKAQGLEKYHQRLFERLAQDVASKPLLSIFRRKGRHTFYIVHDNLQLPLRLLADRTAHQSSVEIDRRDEICTQTVLEDLLGCIVEHYGFSLIEVTKVPLGSDWFYTYVIDYH